LVIRTKIYLITGKKNTIAIEIEQYQIRDKIEPGPTGLRRIKDQCEFYLYFLIKSPFRPIRQIKSLSLNEQKTNNPAVGGVINYIFILLI
jgi:hypothetical protein